MATLLTIRNDTTLVLVECYLCGVRFYCPNGHSQAYVESSSG